MEVKGTKDTVENHTQVGATSQGRGFCGDSRRRYKEERCASEGPQDVCVEHDLWNTSKTVHMMGKVGPILRKVLQ